MRRQPTEYPNKLEDYLAERLKNVTEVLVAEGNEYPHLEYHPIEANVLYGLRTLWTQQFYDAQIAQFAVAKQRKTNIAQLTMTVRAR